MLFCNSQTLCSAFPYTINNTIELCLHKEAPDEFLYNRDCLRSNDPEVNNMHSVRDTVCLGTTQFLESRDGQRRVPVLTPPGTPTPPTTSNALLRFAYRHRHVRSIPSHRQTHGATQTPTRLLIPALHSIAPQRTRVVLAFRRLPKRYLCANGHRQIS